MLIKCQALYKYYILISYNNPQGGLCTKHQTDESGMLRDLSKAMLLVVGDVGFNSSQIP